MHCRAHCLNQTHEVDGSAKFAADDWGRTDMHVKKLFIKHEHGAQLTRTESMDFSPEGIAGNVACAPFRNVLLASQSVTADCGLRDSDLRENVVVDYGGLYDLP